MSREQPGSERIDHENIDSEQHPISQNIGSSDNLVQERADISPLSILPIVYSAIGCFIFFILWILWLLSSLQVYGSSMVIQTLNTLNSTSSLQVGEIKTEESEDSLDFLSQMTEGENIDIKFAKYLVSSVEVEAGEEAQRKKHENQKKYYTKLYGESINEVLPEASMCIVATGRNNMGAGRQARFLSSVEHLNYTNYRLVYVDDCSEDSTYQFTCSFVAESKALRQKSFVIPRDRRYFALANKIKAIDEHCQQSDIILDVDADDCFIGREALNVVNFLYNKNQGAWLLYTNHLISSRTGVEGGKNRGLTEQQFQTYRTSDLWVTSHLKSFRAELYKKIDQNQWKREDGEFYHWASDRFLMYSLIELAGLAHTVFQNVILYLYDYGAAAEFRNFQIIKPDKFRSQLLTPYEHLESLESPALKRKNYEPPSLIKEYYRRAQLKYEQLMRRSTHN